MQFQLGTKFAKRDNVSCRTISKITFVKCFHFTIRKNGVNFNLNLVIASNAISRNRAQRRLASQTKRTLEKIFFLIGEGKYNTITILIQCYYCFSILKATGHGVTIKKDKKDIIKPSLFLVTIYCVTKVLIYL